jgi:hypothetical protein
LCIDGTYRLGELTEDLRKGRRDWEVAKMQRNKGVLGAFVVGTAVLSVVGCSGADGSSEPGTEDIGQARGDLSLQLVCGGPKALTCSSNKFCLTIPGLCASPTVFGVCVARPTSCPSTSTPVCGCDGKTYPNVCKAAAGGTSVAQFGACPPPPDPCAAVQCPTGQECVVQSDGTAVCAELPDPCARITCPINQKCVAQPDGTPACEPAPCFGVVCPTGQTCEPQPDGTGVCVTPLDPCARIVCMTGETCVAPDGGAPVCVPTP